MIAMKEKRDLFGGALFGAGIVAAAVATSAMAEFVPAEPLPGYPQNILRAFGDGLPGYVGGIDFSDAAVFPTTQSYISAGLSTSAYAGSSLIGVAVNLSDAYTWTTAGALAVQWFTVESSKKILFEWDLTNTPHGGSYVSQAGVGVISTIALPGSSGSESIVLSPGVTYRFGGEISITGQTGDGFARISNIPAPGALALLGIGMIGIRSRRRE